MQTITIDGKTYERVDQSDALWRIVVLDRGFVVVGRVSMDGESMVVIRDASCVRRWGTEKGLGELAEKGPLSETVLDPQGTTRVHILQVVQQIDCDQTKWTQ